MICHLRKDNLYLNYETPLAHIYNNNSADDNFIADKDLLMEQILANMNNTPIGQVLKRIASLPEVRKEKVLDIRKRLTQGQYDLNERLDMALDKVLDDLIT